MILPRDMGDVCEEYKSGTIILKFAIQKTRRVVVCFHRILYLVTGDCSANRAAQAMFLYQSAHLFQIHRHWRGIVDETHINVSRSSGVTIKPIIIPWSLSRIWWARQCFPRSFSGHFICPAQDLSVCPFLLSDRCPS